MNRFSLSCSRLMFAIHHACLRRALPQPSDWIRFTLEPQRGNGGKIHASFRDEERGRDREQLVDRL